VDHLRRSGSDDAASFQILTLCVSGSSNEPTTKVMDATMMG
jgi:hypothetical protein